MATKVINRILLILTLSVWAVCPLALANGVDYSDTGGSFFVPNDNVGIGSASPGQKLDVQGTVRDMSEILQNNPSPAVTTNALYNNSGTLYFNGSAVGGGGGWTLGAGNVGISTTNNVGIGTNLTTTAALTVMSGNVGIGTWIPAAALDLKGGNMAINTNEITGGNMYFQMNGASGYTLSNPNNGWGVNITADWLRIGTGGEGQGNLQFSSDTGLSRLSAGVLGVGTGATNSLAGELVANNVGIGTFNPFGGGLIVLPASTGNVGIGSLTPGQALDVQGTVRTTGFALNAGTPGYGYVLTATDSSGDTMWSAPGAAGGWMLGVGNVGISTTNNVGIGTSTPQGALVVTNGNVGIGTWTTSNNLLNVAGSVGIGTIYTANYSAPSNSLIIQSNLGIGTWNPAFTIDVRGSNPVFNMVGQMNATKFVDVNNGSYWVKPLGTTNLGYFTSAALGGNVGIGTFITPNQLVVDGGVGIGTAYSSYVTTYAAPAGGLIVQGNVGIGSFNPSQMLDVQGIVRDTGETVNGNVGIGTSFTTTSALTVMNGNVGIGTWIPVGVFQVYKNAASGVLVIDANGNLGLGTTTPQASLAVTQGNVGIGTWTAAGGNLIVNGGGNVGIGSAWPGYTLDVNGGARVGGSGFSTFNTNVGIGSNAPGVSLDIQGGIRSSQVSGQSAGTLLCVRTDGTIGYCSGSVTAVSCTCN